MPGNDCVNFFGRAGHYSRGGRHESAETVSGIKAALSVNYSAFLMMAYPAEPTRPGSVAQLPSQWLNNTKSWIAPSIHADVTRTPHFGDERQRLNDRRIFSDREHSGEFFEPHFDQGLAARVMGIVEAAQSFWPSFFERANVEGNPAPGW
jgi:hypothetical protein